MYIKSIIVTAFLVLLYAISIHANTIEMSAESAANTALQPTVLLADNRRKDRRDDRQGDRDDRRDCRQDEGVVGKDKRECKQEEVHGKDNADNDDAKDAVESTDNDDKGA